VVNPYVSDESSFERAVAILTTVLAATEFAGSIRDARQIWPEV
jgi:hypothetical protein